jgi:hypothetical protein
MASLAPRGAWSFQDYVMSLDSINLPKGVGPDAEKMLDAILGADDAQALNRAGGKAEGFVLGLESAKAIKSAVAEQLYIVYDAAASGRAEQLPG